MTKSVISATLKNSLLSVTCRNWELLLFELPLTLSPFQTSELTIVAISAALKSLFLPSVGVDNCTCRSCAYILPSVTLWTKEKSLNTTKPTNIFISLPISYFLLLLPLPWLTSEAGLKPFRTSIAKLVRRLLQNFFWQGKLGGNLV